MTDRQHPGPKTLEGWAATPRTAEANRAVRYISNMHPKVPRDALPVEFVDGTIRIVLRRPDYVLTRAWNLADGNPRYAEVSSGHASCGGSHVTVTWHVRILDAEGAVLDTFELEDYY